MKLVEYSDKPAAYFSRVRDDIARFLPKGAGLRAMEVGCSHGATLAWLKREGYCSWVCGVEPYADLDASLTDEIDQHHAIDIENDFPDIAPASLDLIICLDVLEHLVDPWLCLKKLDALLKPGGCFIISLPNIRHYRILNKLVFEGRFEYEDSGILDRTHLRFFTRHSAEALACSSGCRIEGFYRTNIRGHWRKLLSRLGFADFFATQFVFLARKSAGS